MNLAQAISKHPNSTILLLACKEFCSRCHVINFVKKMYTECLFTRNKVINMIGPTKRTKSHSVCLSKSASRNSCFKEFHLSLSISQQMMNLVIRREMMTTRLKK